MRVRNAPRSFTDCDWGATAAEAGQASRAAKRSMSAEVPETMMRSWSETTVSAVA